MTWSAKTSRITNYWLKKLECERKKNCILSSINQYYTFFYKFFVIIYEITQFLHLIVFRLSWRTPRSSIFLLWHRLLVFKEFLEKFFGTVPSIRAWVFKKFLDKVLASIQRISWWIPHNEVSIFKIFLYQFISTFSKNFLMDFSEVTLKITNFSKRANVIIG